MIRSKKGITFLAFTLGALLFVSTAFADMALGSGYDLLKNSVKQTAAQMENNLDNFTVEALLSFKINDETILQSSDVRKYDMEKGAMEESSVQHNLNGEISTYESYSDPEVSIWKNSDSDTYYVTRYDQDGIRNERSIFTNPFNEEGAADIEKIFDALVSNLKDHIQVEEQAEGGRMFSGKLTEMQVPALVNAVSSFLMKQTINDQHYLRGELRLPKVESDIYVKKITGQAVENNNGLLEHMTGEIVLSGKDAEGVQHEMTLNILVKLADVGSTQVVKPDLSNAKVEQVSHVSGFTFYEGTYKNNIVIEENGQLVKIGERTLEIISADGNKVIGRYDEFVKPEYADRYHEPYHFEFEYRADEEKPMSFFTYTNALGEEEHGQIHPGSHGKIYLELNIEVIDEHAYRSNMDYHLFDSEFVRVFEE